MTPYSIICNKSHHSKVLTKYILKIHRDAICKVNIYTWMRVKKKSIEYKLISLSQLNIDYIVATLYMSIKKMVKEKNV